MRMYVQVAASGDLHDAAATDDNHTVALSGGGAADDGTYADGDGVVDLKRFLLSRAPRRPWRASPDRATDMSPADRVTEVRVQSPLT